MTAENAGTGGETREPTAPDLFEDYVPGWPHDAQLTSSFVEILADDIVEAVADEKSLTAEVVGGAIIDSLGLNEEYWLAIRLVDNPLFGAHQWHACPKCGHTDQGDLRGSSASTGGDA